MNRFTRLIVGSVVLAMIGGTAFAAPPDPLPAGVDGERAVRPNILLILLDDLGVDYVEGYGEAAGTYGPTPVLDTLMTYGTSFRRAYVSPVCSPTRAGLVTGRYQQRSGVPGVIFADPKQNRHHGLHPREVTFAELLIS